MAGIQRISDRCSVRALADLLNGDSRTRPVVVVTIPAGRAEPWIDIEQIAREAGDLTDIYLMPTGDCTWEFSRHMAEGTQVYGGAGRVYPIGHEWVADLTRSPRRFAFNASDGGRATQQLISDALHTAASAGLLQSLPTRALRQVEGEVTMTVAGRALVDVGNRTLASIAEELTVQDVPIERLVVIGQRVEGRYDDETNRIDLTRCLRPAADALASYSAGDIVLAKVVMVRDDTADLVLYPRTTTPAVFVTVTRDDVTTNPLADLHTLMTVGEVVAARVVATAPGWALALKDVDDDEPIVAAPSLLPGGPPWLVEEPQEADVEEQEPVAPPALLPMPTADAVPVIDVPSSLQTATPPRPGAAATDKDVCSAQPAAEAPAATAQPRESTKTLVSKVESLAATVNGLKRDRDSLRTDLRASADRQARRDQGGEGRRCRVRDRDGPGHAGPEPCRASTPHRLGRQRSRSTPRRRRDRLACLPSSEHALSAPHPLLGLAQRTDRARSRRHARRLRDLTPFQRVVGQWSDRCTQ